MKPVRSRRSGIGPFLASAAALTRELRILLLADTMLILAMGMFGPLYAIFVQEIGGNVLTAGWAYATFSMTTGLVILLLSSLASSIRRFELLIPLGYGLCSLGILGYLFVRTPMHLFFVQAVMGVALAVLVPSWDALYSNFVNKERAVFEWGVQEALDYIVPAIAAGVGSLIASSFGFRVLFLSMLAASVAGTLISLQILRRSFSNDLHAGP